MKRLPTRYCDECDHSDWDFRPFEGSKMVSWFHVCTKGHKPRFYTPKGPMDETACYKRKCNNFEERKGITK